MFQVLVINLLVKEKIIFPFTLYAQNLSLAFSLSLSLFLFFYFFLFLLLLFFLKSWRGDLGPRLGPALYLCVETQGN